MTIEQQKIFNQTADLSCLNIQGGNIICNTEDLIKDKILKNNHRYFKA